VIGSPFVDVKLESSNGLKGSAPFGGIEKIVAVSVFDNFFQMLEEVFFGGVAVFVFVVEFESGVDRGTILEGSFGEERSAEDVGEEGFPRTSGEKFEGRVVDLENEFTGNRGGLKERTREGSVRNVCVWDRGKIDWSHKVDSKENFSICAR
jgi:hypothetical protein